MPKMCCTANGRLLSAFDAIKAVRYGPQWKTTTSSAHRPRYSRTSSTAGFAAISWLIPNQPDSDHPGEKVDNGPSWVASVVNAIGESAYWDSTAIVIVWDDWGGFYDNLDPAQCGIRRPGLSGTGADRLFVRQERLRLDNAVRVRQHLKVHREELASRYAPAQRQARHQHRRMLRLRSYNRSHLLRSRRNTRPHISLRTSRRILPVIPIGRSA